MDQSRAFYGTYEIPLKGSSIRLPEEILIPIRNRNQNLDIYIASFEEGAYCCIFCIDQHGLLLDSYKDFFKKHGATLNILGIENDSITLPREVIRLLKLEGMVTLLGVYDRFEIWKPEKEREYFTNTNFEAAGERLVKEKQKNKN